MRMIQLAFSAMDSSSQLCQPHSLTALLQKKILTRQIKSNQLQNKYNIICYMIDYFVWIID